MRRILICSMLLAALTLTAWAQDAFNLPAELYVLTNDGVVQQYGLGAAGIRTVTPEDTFVIDFGVAPDGNWLAYRTETGLHLTHVYTGGDEVIENETASIPPLRGRGDTVAWSPQGDALAYTTSSGARFFFNTGAQPVFTEVTEGQFLHLSWSPDGRYLAAATETHIWWIYRREETRIVLTSVIPSALGMVWVGVAQLAFAPPDGGLIVMDLASANAQTVLLDNTRIFEQPQRLPDGRLVAFARDPNDEDTEPGSGLLVALAPGAAETEPLSETVVEVSAMRWTPPGELNFMIALQGGVMALVDPVSAQGFTLPITDVVAYSWGPLAPPAVTGTTLPADGYFLSQDGTGVAQVWRLPADGEPSTPVTTSETAVTSYAVAPDGRGLAYSDGAGIWLQPLGDDEPVSLREDGDNITGLNFSPDSRRIAFVDGGVWVVPANGAEAEEVLAAPQDSRRYALPRFASNLGALLVNIDLDDQDATGMLDTNSGELLEMPPGYANGRWLSDGRILTYGVDNPSFEGGLQITDLSAIETPIVLLADSVAVRDAREITPGTLRLLLTANVKGPAALRVVDMNINSGELTPVADGGFIVAPSLSPDGQFVAGYRYLTPDQDDGPLTIRNLAEGQQVSLSQPTPVWGFQWGSQR